MPECLLSALGQDYVSRLFFVPEWVLSLVFRSRQAAPGISVLASNSASNLFPVLVERIDYSLMVFNVWMYIGVSGNKTYDWILLTISLYYWHVLKIISDWIS